MENKRDTAVSLSERFKGWIKGGKGLQAILIVGILGIVLIGLSSILPKKTTSKTAASSSSTVSAEEYREQLEQRLSDIVGSIDGAGKCRVMVTLENGVEYVYAKEEKVNNDKQQEDSKISQSSDSEQQVIVVDTEDGKQGLLVTEIQPTVKGVVVVCEGGDQSVVQQRITSTITTALNISSKRVCVTKSSD